LHDNGLPGFLSRVSKLRVFVKYWLPVMVWMAVIFSASSDTNSARRSSRLIEPFIRWLFPDIHPDNIWPIVLFVRKCAHLTEYAVLALLLWRAFRSVSVQTAGWSWRLARNAWFGVIAYAITDEVHQTFVPGRQGSAWDVLIDSLGGAAGLLVLWALGRWRKWW
jgi:VanZ family protein